MSNLRVAIYTQRRIIMKCSHCGAEAGEKLVCAYCGARTNPQYVPLNDATKVDTLAKIDDVPNVLLIFFAFLGGFLS